LVAAGATYLAYVEAREDSGTTLTAARTLSTIVLFAIALWVLALLVRLGDRRQRWLVPTMAGGFVAALLVPAARTFFALSIPRPLVLMAGVGVVAISGLLLEVGWSLAGWLGGGRRRSGPG
jgi:cation-transporting ATPase E